MRVLLIVLGCLCGSVTYGQGYLVFQNGNSTAITNYDSRFPPVGGRASIETRVGLYVNADTSAQSDSPGWVHIYTTNLILPGIFFGGMRALVNPSGTILFPAFTPVAVQVRAWRHAIAFETYEEAYAAFPFSSLGTSEILTVLPSPATSAPPNLVNAGLRSIFLYGPIPEPSTWALIVLGIGAFAMLRRHKPRD